VAGADGVTIALSTADGQAETIAAERVLVAVGRRPRTEGLGLEALGVQMAGDFIAVNETMQTSVPGVYAIGDCVPTLPLAHVASAEGVLAVEHIAGREVAPLHYDQMPRCTYSRPEVASIGLSEEEAVRRGYQVRVGRFPFKNIARATVLGESEGLVKVVTDARYDAILGVHLVGPQATELIAAAAALLRLEATTEELVRTVHAHPTLAEALPEAGHAVNGQAIYL
jgi:dihydrolipoamide dehydrogenase